MSAARYAPGALAILALGFGLPAAADHGHGHDHGHDHGHGHGRSHGEARGARQVGLGDARAPELAAALPPEVVQVRREVADALDGHDFRVAARQVKRLLARDPHDRWANMVLSDALVELGDVDGAAAALQEVLDRKPTGAAYLRAGYLLHLQGDTAAAIETFRWACEALPQADRASRAWAHTELGHLHWHQGRLDAAAAEYGRALVLDPRLGEARVGVARVAAACGDPWTAVHELERAARSPEHLGELALLQAGLGWREEAAESLARAERLLEDDPLWARSMALCLADNALDPERAVALAREEVERRPSAHSHDALAWALARAGRGDEALRHARRALATGVQEPLMLFHAGMAARAAGEAAQAAGWLRAALALNADFHPRFAPMAREALNELDANDMNDTKEVGR